jgi:hypothetical protein
METEMAINQCVLYKDENFIGEPLLVFDNISDLKDYGFNDEASSLVIVEGRWNFYKDKDYQGQLGQGGGVALGPGTYRSLTSALGNGANDAVSSVKIVS